MKVDGVFASACTDLLFDPDEYGIDNLDGGLAQMIYKAIESCDTDVQPDLWRNVVLAGGTTMIGGFGERVREELVGILDSKNDNNAHRMIQVIPDATGSEPGYNSQRKIGSWIGGSIFASLDTFGKVLVSKQEYEDAGNASIFHRKAVV